MEQKHSWSSEAKAEFLIRIGGLLEQGYTISECIELFLKYENKKLKPLLTEMLQQLQMGRSFSSALSSLQMPNNIISFVYFSEHYGNLAKGLVEGGKILRKIEVNKQKLQKLLKYPIFLFWTLIVFSFILHQYLFPQLVLLFFSIDVQLPLLTRIFLAFIEKLPYYILFLSSTIFMVFTYYFFVFRKKKPIDKAKILCRIPIVGRFFQIMITYSFSANFSCLIKSGMSVYEALSIFHKQNSQKYLGMDTEHIISKLEKGEQFHRVLIDHTNYLKELAYIVEHGQINGRLDDELDHYSSWLLDEFDSKLKKIFSVIQPLLFVIIGVIVLIMFASIIIPIFSIVDGI